MPARHDQNDLGAGLQTRLHIGLPPFPHAIAHGLAVGLSARLHRIIDDGEIGSAAGDATQHTDRVVLTACGGFPAPGSLIIRRQFVAERRGVFVDEVAHAASETVRQFSGM